MSRPVNINETLTFNPSAYDSGTFTTSTNTSYQTSNALTNTSSTSYARFTVSTTSQYCIYSFNVTGIPSNATITSVSCSVKAYATSTNVTTRTVQLYSGTTAMGSTYTLPTSNSTFTLTNPGTWTLAQLENAKIRFTGLKSSSGGGNNNYYIRFYGANLSVTYSIQGTEYEIISTLSTDEVDSISPAGQTYVMGGDSYELNVYVDNLDDISVLDNDVDVTNQLVLTHSTGESTTDTFIPTSYDSANSFYDSIYEGSTTNGLTSHTDTNRICAFVEQTEYAEAKLTYNFDCSSIPQNAIISSVTCIASASCYSSGQYFDTKTLQLYSGSTAKGSAVTITGNGSTSANHNINGGTWTRAELDNAKIVVYIQRGNNTTQASFSFWGATLSVTYSLPADDYYVYTLSNVSEDHTIIIANAIIEIPEEDPQYNYYPITISSINATTTPGRGTTRIVEGTSQTITIYPDDPQLTLATDNGTDITSQLVQHGGTIPDPTVATATGASYGFTLNSSTGYYTSANTGVDKSAAVCRVSFNIPVRCLVTINYINYAEATYDFGVFGNIDTALNTNYYVAGSNGATISDTSYKLACNTSSYNSSSVQTITYEIPSGQHYIDIKYSKDDATASNNDSLQWKITSIEPLESNNYYTYTLSNIQASHSLIFVFGDVSYYLVNSSGSGAKLYPNGSMVHLQGDTYRLTIVPDDYAYNVSVTDNNVNVSSQVQRKEEQVTKDGNTYTVVNFIYTLNNIQATHNIVVICTLNESLYLKVNNSWVMVSKIYKKINNVWTEVTLNSLTEPNVYIMK